MIAILVADDHTLLREGLREMLELDPELRVIGQAGDGLDAVRLAKDLQPDVVLMDINLPGLNGIAATRMILAQQPSSRVIMLTMYEDEQYIAEAVRAGASGYVLKSISRQDLVRAIKVVHAGESVIQPTLAGKVLRKFAAATAAEAPANEPPREPLSLREMEVLRLVARGDSNERIAAILNITGNTVKTHIRSIFQKLHVGDRAEAVACAMRLGMLH